jgi:ankyrin repeat protein
MLLISKAFAPDRIFGRHRRREGSAKGASLVAMLQRAEGSVTIQPMKMPILVLGFLFLLSFSPPLFVVQINSKTPDDSAKPVQLSAKEVDSNRIHSRPVLRVKLDKQEAETLIMEGILVEVTVGLDGAVTEAVAIQADPEVPPNLVSQAVAVVRALHYRPFQRNGRAVLAKFEEEVPILPADRESARHVPFPSPRNWESVRITLERDECFGTCPAYKVEIHGDGTVLYDGHTFVALRGQHRGSTTKKNVTDLINKFRQADYYSLQKYYALGVTDLPLFRTSIKIGDRRKTVADYAGIAVGMPLAVSELEDSIDELADTARWTKGNAETIQILRDEKLDFSSPEAATILARVVEFGNAEAVRDLLAAGTPTNGLDDKQWSPLKRSASRGDPEILRALLNADAVASDAQSVGPLLILALQSGNVESADLLLNHGASPESHEGLKSSLMAAAESGVPVVVEGMLKRVSDVNARDDRGKTALMYAIGELDQGGEDPSVDRPKAVALLLSAGADPNARDNEGNTPLIDCRLDPDVALELIKAGANVNARNGSGRTPLMSALKPDVVQVLLEKGADVLARDQRGKTALDLAKQDGLIGKAALIEQVEHAK